MSQKKEIVDEINKINDIKITDEIKNVDVSVVFVLSKLRVLKKIFKKNTLDLILNTKKYINLSLKPKIKLIKLKKPISDLKKVKKNKNVDINNYKPKIDEFSLNLLNLENINIQNWPYSDIFLLKSNFFKKIIKKFRKLKINFNLQLKNKNIFQFLSAFILLIIFWFWYIQFINTKIEKSFKNLENIDFYQDMNLIKKDLINSKNDFIIIWFLLKWPFVFNDLFLQNNNLDNLKNIVYWTKKIIDFWLDSTIIYDWIQKIINQKWVGEIMYSQLLTNINPLLSTANSNLNQAILYFDKISNLWDKDLNNKFFSKLSQAKILKWYLNTFYDNQDIIKSILADKEKKTYAIVFQNSDEIRPTWWFMWSIWFLDIFKWKILNFKKKDIYELEWNIKDFSTQNWVAFLEQSPEWINKISNTFWLRDANYFYNVSQSSEKIKSFLDKTNYKIDWIIYINQNLILDALDKFWWIYFDYVSREINSSNFSMIISTLVESKITKTHTFSTPKQILFDFINLYFEKIKKEKDYTWYINLFFDSIKKRDIIIYNFNKEENDFIKNIWLINEYDFDLKLDFNYPVFTSISWNKSDRYIKRSFEKKYQINEDCSINTSLWISQKSEFNINEEIKIKNFLYDMNLLWIVDIDETLKIQWKAQNKQFIRVLLPAEAKIIQKSNIKISKFDNYQEVSFYINTWLLFASEFVIEYVLPNIECKNYDFNFIKQPWIKNYNLNLYKNWNLINSIYTDKDFLFN